MTKKPRVIPEVGQRYRTPDGTVFTITRSMIMTGSSEIRQPGKENEVRHGKVKVLLAFVQTDPPPKYGAGDWVGTSLIPDLVECGALTLIEGEAA